jgi:hypothetical protein
LERLDTSQWAKILGERMAALPVVDDATAPLSTLPKEFRLSTSLVLSLWQEFKRHIAEPVPTAPEQAAEVVHRVRRAFGQLQGVSARHGLPLAIIYSGTPSDGFCDLMVREGEDAVAAYRRLKFDETMPGLVMAMNFSAALKRKWSWGHGLYDRDAELLVGDERLIAILSSEARSLPPVEQKSWPPTSLRIARLADGWQVSCLATRPGVGLQDLSVTLTDGAASPLRSESIWTWGRGVLY